MGTSFQARGTEEFYAKQFHYIHGIGIDNLAWEFNATRNKTLTVPSPAALQALMGEGMKISPVYDLEISLQVYQNRDDVRAELATPGLIGADQATTDMICRDLGKFYQQVPKDRLGTDENGNTVAFVYGFGFSDADIGVAAWDSFADRLNTCLAPTMGAHWKLYWTATNHPFEEHLFLKYGDHFAPWQFVSDMPQSQFSHDAVTWNFGFDNLGVQRRDNLLRVIRADPRYLEETAWLASAADPALLFLYGWNEPFENSFLFPNKIDGSLKADTARNYIALMRGGSVPPLPKVLVIVDDLDELWSSRRGDWHLLVLQEMLLYRMRLFVPQSDVTVIGKVTKDLLSRYEGVIDLTSRKTSDFVLIIKSQLPRLKLMAFDPLAGTGRPSYIDHFLSEASYVNLNNDLPIIDSKGLRVGQVLARDDIHDGVACTGCNILLWAQSNKLLLPLIVTNENSVFVNSYANTDYIMTAAFQAFYGRPMECSLLYGEGLKSQRLEIAPNGRITENRLSRGSVDLRLPLSFSKLWLQLPSDIPQNEKNFLFGLNEEAILNTHLKSTTLNQCSARFY